MQTERRRYRVRVDRLNELLNALGYAREGEKVAFIGIDWSTWIRLKNGGEPNATTMGRLQDLFPALPFEALIERVDVEAAVAS